MECRSGCGKMRTNGEGLPLRLMFILSRLACETDSCMRDRMTYMFVIMSMYGHFRGLSSSLDVL